MTLETALPVL